MNPIHTMLSSNENFAVSTDRKNPPMAPPRRGICAAPKNVLSGLVNPLPEAVRGGWATALLLLVLFMAGPAQARVNVVSLPGRDSVQLTIYNSVDLTLVKETRHLTFRKGMNRLEFSWANTLIDPTSVEFRALTHADQVDVLDVSFPPRVNNTLEWRIQSEVAGDVVVEIRYFTSGIRWDADYVVEAAQDEKTAGLTGSVRVTNNSGEDYENAQVRLVVGTIKLVEEIAQLAQQGRPGGPTARPVATSAMATPLAATMRRSLMDRLDKAEARVKEVVKEALSEYFLYTVEGRDTIPSGWSKRLPSFHVAAVPLISLFKFEKERFGEQVIRHYTFKNDKASKLGDAPLPDGAVKAFRLRNSEGLHEFVGATRTKYIPIGEETELELGNDPEVQVKPVMMNWEKTDLRFDDKGKVIGWTIKETWEIDLQNSRLIDVLVDVRRNFSGDWTMTTDAARENLDANKMKFLVPLKAREQRKLSYTVATRYGANATR
jgi:hypothetical protein